jgi:FkbM family methyltransferase
VRSASDSIWRALRHYDPSQLPFQIEEIVDQRSYLRNGIRVGEGDVVLDVGANVGVAAILFATECGAGLVHCFEPVAPLFELLRQNVAGFSACVPHPYGLGSRSGPAQITYYPAAASMSGLYADVEADSAVVRQAMLNSGASPDEVEASLKDRYRSEILSCELRTLSSVLRELELERVDLLKVDVEGAELDVLEGMREEDWPLIQQAVIEIHDRDRRGGAVAGHLRRRGFHLTIEQEPLMRGTDVHLAYGTRA